MSREIDCYIPSLVDLVASGLSAKEAAEALHVTDEDEIWEADQWLIARLNQPAPVVGER